MSKVLVPLADGCEEMEAVIVIDTLRRAQWGVTSVGLKKGMVTASRGVKLVPDAVWDEVDPLSFDMIVVPGGNQGVENLRADARVLKVLQAFRDAGKWIHAICAGPLVLQEAGVLTGKTMTCYPSAASKITTAKRIDEKVVKDGNMITSQGPGTTIEFALSIIEAVDGKAKAREVAQAMVVDF